MASLKGDRFLQFTISSGNKFQSLIVAGKKECLKVSVVILMPSDTNFLPEVSDFGISFLTIP